MDRSDLRIFAAELSGTFILVVLATGLLVYDAQAHGTPGVVYAALGPLIALTAGVYAFGRTSMAHFNPAVTIGYFITGHVPRARLAYYLAAELAGAFLGSLFVMHVIGTEADLGANAPDYAFPIQLIFGVEALASGLLMAVILAVAYAGGMRGLGGVAIGGMVSLDILFLGFISGASMNPARSLAPAVLSGVLGSLWLYWTATFAGTCTVGLLFRRKFRRQAE